MDHIPLTRAITALTSLRSHVQIPGPSPQTAPSLESAGGRGGTSVRVSPAAGMRRHCLLRLPGTLLTALLGTEQDPRRRMGTLSNNHRNAAASRFQCGSALCRHITSPFCTSGFSSYKGEENTHTQKGKVGSGQKSLVLHPRHSSAHANNPRIAGAAPQLLLLV